MPLHRALVAIASSALKVSAAAVLSQEGWQPIEAESHLAIVCYLVPMVTRHAGEDLPEVVVCDREAEEYLRSLHIGPWNVKLIPFDEEHSDPESLRGTLREISWQLRQ